jgi:hypothetical protein
MGVDTKGYLNREISVQEIINVIMTKYNNNNNVESNIEIEEYNDGSQIEHGSIYFMDGEDARRLYVYKHLTENEKTSLILSHWNNSVEIMTNILKSFGGELLESDCSGLPAIEIPKDENYCHSDRVKLIDNIISILDIDLPYHDRYKLGNQILRHKEQLKEILI